MKVRSPKHHQSQQGAALIVSLVLLTALTLIGLSSLQVTTLEEKMAGVEHDYNLGFQSAEAALREGENYVEQLVTTAAFGNQAGLLAQDDPDAGDYYLRSSTWAGDTEGGQGSVQISNGSTATASSPAAAYIIKKVGEQTADPNAALNISGYGSTVAGGSINYFRVTARSTGRSGKSQVVLQTYYGKRF